MSKISQDQCDRCKKIAGDKYVIAGWITVSGSITISRGRAADKSAQSLYADTRERDFCGAKCLNDFLKALK